MTWAIYSTDEEAWWNNDNGWVGFDSADTFTSDEAFRFNLPNGPALVLWVRLRDD